MTGTSKSLFLSGVLLVLPLVSMADAIPVELRQTEQGWQLYRDGEPYFIRGAGGTFSLSALAKAGANSVRTWGADDLDELLDEAHSLGLSVSVGIWLGHERHGFDYSDPEQVSAQLEGARETILRYKDHPAVLLWGIGNEMEGFESGDNPLIWKAVNDIAAMAKELDPAHPTMTVTAEIGGGRVDAVHMHSPAIDIHGINSYGGAVSLRKRLRSAGATKPFVITEFGPPGAWEVATTDWGAALEPTSTEKALFYRDVYQKSVLAGRGTALGSYAFNWGFKMEATETWFGMFLSDGSRLSVVDTMTELWSGKKPANLAPQISPLQIDDDMRVEPVEKISVRASVTDPEGGAIRVRWVLRPDSSDYLTGGDFRANLPELEGTVFDAGVNGVTVRMPEYPGPYRLFLYAFDEQGNAATANMPLLVKGEVRTPLPFSVYEESFDGMPWAPSGWMGNVDALKMNGEYPENPHSGQHCIQIRYEGLFNWVAVAWQNPPNDWGETAGGYDMRGARALELWARGEYGGEKVSFGVGLLESDRDFPDSAKTAVDDIVLTSDWQRFRVPLNGLDLSVIKSGFVVGISGRRSAVTVYLDDIRFIP